MSQDKDPVALPPLPERDGDWAGDDWYTADSMHNYALAALQPGESNIHEERKG